MAARKLKAVPPLNQLDNYPYPECRGEHHDWQPYDGRIDEKARRCYRVQRCPNCTTKKKSILSLRDSDYGLLVKPATYDWPKDYRVPGGVDRRDLGRMRMPHILAEIAKGK